MNGVLVIGAGGHAKVVADILLRQGTQVAGFLDDDPSTWGTTRLGLPVLGGIEMYPRLKPLGMVLAVGDNRARQQIALRLGPKVRKLWVNAIHPQSVMADSVRTGRGVVIAAGAVVNPDAEIMDHCIINTAASIDHDCRVGPFAHAAPGSHTAGGVTIGEGALVGVGATIIPGCTIGAWATVGAGAVVVRDIPAGVTAKGVPARW